MSLIYPWGLLGWQAFMMVIYAINALFEMVPQMKRFGVKSGFGYTRVYQSNANVVLCFAVAAVNNLVAYTLPNIWLLVGLVPVGLITMFFVVGWMFSTDFELPLPNFVYFYGSLLASAPLIALVQIVLHLGGA